MKKISQFDTITARNNDDWLLIEEASTGAYKKIKVSDFIAGLSTSSESGATVITKTLTYSFDGDSNGVCYWLGSNYGQKDWINPHTTGKIICSLSSTYDGNDPPENLVDRQLNERPATQDIPNSWMKLNIGLRKLKCNYYSLRGRNFVSEHLRSWKLQGSNDDISWDDLDVQVNNSSINQNIWWSCPVSSSLSYQYFRVLQTGLSSNRNNIMTLGEWEFYGSLEIAN